MGRPPTSTNLKNTRDSHMPCCHRRPLSASIWPLYRRSRFAALNVIASSGSNEQLTAADSQLASLAVAGEADRATQTDKRSSIPMPSLVKKMAKAYSRNATAEVKADHPKPPLRSSLRDCEEEDEDDEANRGRRDDLSHSRSPFYRQSPQTIPYSLSSGPLSRRASHASSASSSSFFDAAIQKLPVSPPIGSPVSDESSWEEQLSQIVTSAAVSEEIPSIHPSSHMKTLLLQLASTISALKTSFAQMKASARAGEPIKKSESAMEEELKRLSNLQIGMYELIQQYDLGSQGGPHAPQTCDSNMNNMPSDAEKQGMILKSYEGIIKRFHDEIRKKDAVTDALKETLAKTVLKSEKLEKRVKSLEAKLAAMELK